MAADLIQPGRGTGSSRIQQIDVLRGGAILLVMIRHGFSSELAGSAAPLVRHLYFFSATGVDLFFVLSGFLIGGLLFKEIRRTGKLDAKRFLVRRTLRIWPGYFAFVGFAFFQLVRHGRYTPGAAMQALGPNLVHLQNYFGSPRGITWSLAAQEHFYLALPLLLLAATRGKRFIKSIPVIPWVACLLIVTCTSLRIALNWHRPYNIWTHVTPTHLRIDGMFFGVLLAYLFHFHHALLARIAGRRLLLLFVWAIAVGQTWFIDEGSSPFTWTLGFAVLYVGYGCLVVAAIFSRPGDGLLGAVLASRPALMLASIGVFTYSIYLWHYDLGLLTVHNHVMPHLPRMPGPLYWALLTCAYLGVAICAGIVMAKLIEFPAIRLRDRMFPSCAGAATRQSSAAFVTSERAFVHAGPWDEVRRSLE